MTSPPCTREDYETDPASDGSPASWPEYLELLAQVFAECRRVLEPGGRIAVNVANLGRKPYRSLSGEVLGILERLGFLIRGEHIWVKAEAQAGSTAFGSWMSPANPVMRDLTERIVVASYSQFASRSVPRGSPGNATAVAGDDQQGAVHGLDLRHVADPAESPRRVGLRPGTQSIGLSV